MSPTAPTAAHRPFSWRAFTSLVVVFAFTVLAVTGIALYATPPGRVANWSGWTLAGLTKANWQAVHMVFGSLFVAAGALHLFFNWKVLLAYLRSRTHAGVPRKRELAWATGIGLVLAAASIGDLPPVSAIATGRDTLANSWTTAADEPPIPHAELLTVQQVAASANVSVETALERLRSQGYTVAADEPLEQIAARRGVTPQAVYGVLVQAGPQSSAGLTPPVSGAGMGWKTVQQVAGELNVPVPDALARLRAAGVEASADDTLRGLAKRVDRHAPELLAIIAAR